MPIESTRETMAAFLKDLSDRGPYERHLAPDVTFTGAHSGTVVVGRAAVAELIRQVYHEAFNAHLLIKVALIDDERAVMEVDFVGTHRGMFQGIAATGRKVSVPGSMVFDFRDGTIIVIRGYLSIGQLLSQIGVPSPEDEG